LGSCLQSLIPTPYVMLKSDLKTITLIKYNICSHPNPLGLNYLI